MQLAVRARELHCRRGWNDDHWAAAPDDIVLEVRFRPDEPGTDDSARKPASTHQIIELRSVEAIVSAWDDPARAEADTLSPRP